MSILLPRRMTMSGNHRIYLYKNGQYNTSLLGDEEFKVGGLYVAENGPGGSTPKLYFSHEEDHINLGVISAYNRTIRYSAVLKLPQIIQQTKKFGGTLNIQKYTRANFTSEMRSGLGLSQKATTSSSFDTAFGITNLIDFQYKSQLKDNFYLNITNADKMNYAFITIWSCYSNSNLRSLNLYELWIEV